MTAYAGLQSQGGIGNVKDPRVLIIGASGGVGIFAIQIAKHFGAQITAVCSGKNVDFVKSLGANTVIDYTVASLETQLAGLKEEFDIVFDAVGGDEYVLCKTNTIATDTGTFLRRFLNPLVFFRLQ